MSAVEIKGLPSVLWMLQSAARIRWLRLAVVGWHFQVDAVSLTHDHLYDGTSLLLRKGIRRYVHNGDFVLDLGTGHLGLLAVYCARTFRVKVVAVDVNGEFVENAMVVARASGALGIDFRRSDWFSDVHGAFDVIVCNAPYVPTRTGLKAALIHEHPEIWNGGDDGLTHTRKILAQAPRFLTDTGLLLLGINTEYVPRDATLGLVNRSDDLELRTIVESWISRCEVYVLGLTDAYIRSHPPRKGHANGFENGEWCTDRNLGTHLWGPVPYLGIEGEA